MKENMHYIIACIDALAVLCILIGLLTHKLAAMPRWHRIWLAVLCLGLAGQSAILFATGDPDRGSIWMLKDIGASGLAITYAAMHALRALRGKG